MDYFLDSLFHEFHDLAVEAADGPFELGGAWDHIVPAPAVQLSYRNYHFLLTIDF